VTNSKKIRVGVQQRVLPIYRVPLFDALAEAFCGNLSVFAGEPRQNEALAGRVAPRVAKMRKGKNYHLLGDAFYMCLQVGLMEWLEDWQPHVLILEANPRYLRSRAAVRWMHGRGRQVIGWGLGSPDVGGWLNGLRLSARKRLVNSFDALITYSSKGAREYTSLGFHSDRIFVAPNAVTPRPAHPMPKRPSSYRANQPIVVFVGRLQERKRVDTLIRACAALPANIQPLLWIVGAGPSRNALEDLASSMYPHTRFFGAQHGSQLEKHLCLADLFVMPGTGGLAVQEAMSFGLPVIVGIADGTQEDLVRNENGWQLKGDSFEELRSTMEKALKDVAVLRRKGKASYRIVSEEINLEKMVSVFRQAIMKVMEV